jgi:hypothetical protein
MDLTSHEIRRALMILIPLLILAGLAFWHRWLRKHNEDISATLKRRD